jgi:class I fructose-bisphosphate aldolase
MFPKLRAADAVMVAPGMVRMVEDLYVGRDRPGLVIELDWKSWNRTIYQPLTDGRGEGAVMSLASVEDLAAAGVDGVMTYLYVGQLDGRLERSEVQRNAQLARECARWGIGFIVEPRSAREGLDPDAESGKVLSFYCRVAAEIGADIVKVIWPGDADALHEVAESCFVPVVLAGGPGDESAEGATALAVQAMRAGCAGLMFGRKIYQSEDPELTLQRLIEVVHEGKWA